ncbi:MAG: DNA-directed RNA polymerase subunit omega [Candidatus Geothermincolales bacterium]
MLMKVKLDDLLERTGGSRFVLTMLAAKRARQINNYFRHLGHGLGQEVGPQVTSESSKPLTIALEEIVADKIEYERPAEEGIK